MPGANKAFFMPLLLHCWCRLCAGPFLTFPRVKLCCVQSLAGAGLVGERSGGLWTALA